MARRKDLKWPQAITLWGYASTTDEAWQRARKDALRFLAEWGHQAVALGWTEENVVGLIWSLRGRRVVAMTARRAAIRSADGAAGFYRRMTP